MDKEKSEVSIKWTTLVAVFAFVILFILVIILFVRTNSPTSKACAGNYCVTAPQICVEPIYVMNCYTNQTGSSSLKQVQAQVPSNQVSQAEKAYNCTMIKSIGLSNPYICNSTGNFTQYKLSTEVYNG